MKRLALLVEAATAEEARARARIMAEGNAPKMARQRLRWLVRFEGRATTVESCEPVTAGEEGRA